jgi:nucleotide-binding universal stress UspA family protein
MNTLRSIVVHVDAVPRCETRLRIALQLAREHGAQLTALYAVTPAAYTVPVMVNEGGAAFAPALETMDRERCEQARALFDRVLADVDAATPVVKWVDASRSPTFAALAEHGLLTDLLLLGQHDPAEPREAIEGDLVASTLIASGTPALVVPYAGRFEPDAVVNRSSRVLLAWKPTREAARAARAALPWLQQAREVHLAVESPAADGGSDEAAAPGAPELKAWLALHGVRCEVHEHSIGRADAGEMLLSLAADVSADLLAMGCFGHSRARELLLGGASRSVLRSMTLPTLMAH